MFARRAGIMRGLLTAVGGGLMWFIIFASYALAFWYGVKLIVDDTEECLENINDCNPRYDAGSLLIVSYFSRWSLSRTLAPRTFFLALS